MRKMIRKVLWDLVHFRFASNYKIYILQRENIFNVKFQRNFKLNTDINLAHKLNLFIERNYIFSD